MSTNRLEQICKAAKASFERINDQILCLKTFSPDNFPYGLFVWEEGKEIGVQAQLFIMGRKIPELALLCVEVSELKNGMVSMGLDAEKPGLLGISALLNPDDLLGSVDDFTSFCDEISYLLDRAEDRGSWGANDLGLLKIFDGYVV